MISTTDITLTRQGKTLLDKVSLTISKGDFISIIGPNGAGKTTLLKVLLGVLRADTGTVNRVPGLKIGYMPQQLQVESLFPLNAKRFLTLARKIGQDKLDRIINEVKIANVLSKPMSSLSGGELQRILLARALLNDPDLLILDEPVQSLDIDGQLHFYELLETLYKDLDLTILIVSHDLHIVMRTTRRVICLYHHICCEGEPETISRHPRFVELFGGGMSRMLKVYQHAHSHTHDS